MKPPVLWYPVFLQSESFTLLHKNQQKADLSDKNSSH